MMNMLKAEDVLAAFGQSDHDRGGRNGYSLHCTCGEGTTQLASLAAAVSWAKVHVDGGCEGCDHEVDIKTVGHPWR